MARVSQAVILFQLILACEFFETARGSGIEKRKGVRPGFGIFVLTVDLDILIDLTSLAAWSKITQLVE